MDRAPAYYAQVVQCSQDCPLVKNCNVDHNLRRGFLPRGTTSRSAPGRVRLMIVVTNPGDPQPREDKVYKATDPSHLATAAWHFTKATLDGRTDHSRTLSQVLCEAAFLLDCKPLQVLDVCVITNHVKCSTPKAFSKYCKGEELQRRREVSARCVAKHLVDEIEYWRPERIAVFSATARDALQSAGVAIDGYIAHPTARGKNMNRDYRDDQLRRLKAELEADRAR